MNLFGEFSPLCGGGGAKITRKIAEVVYGRPPTQLLNMVTTLLLFAACNHMGSVFGRKLEIYSYVLVKKSKDISFLEE